MGILDKLFGSPQSQKLRLIRELARHRIQTDPAAEAAGMDSSMVDSLTDNQLLMLPEASIATIAETYAGLVQQRMSPQVAISRIDDFRAASFGGTKSTQTSNIFDFIADRVRLEHKNGLPLDEIFIDTATFTSLKF